MKLTGKSRSAGFTLTEVVLALAILAVVFGGIITASIQATRRAEWSGYSLAAQALAIQQLEQARSARWDGLPTPVWDEITNIPSISARQLDVPISDTNRPVWATNYVTISTIQVYANPPASVRMVRVDTVWPFTRNNEIVFFTNSVADFFAPDL